MVKRNHARLAAAAIILISTSFIAPAQQQSTTIPKAETPATGTISGRVISESGQPLFGASVFVRHVGSLNLGRITSTDSEGNFQVSNLDPAVYSVAASLPGYTTIPPDPDAPANYYRAGDSVRLELVKGGIITGTVTNGTGEPVVAVRVCAYLIRDTNGQRPMASITSFGERTTDDRGIYRIYGLAPGTYLVYAGGPGPSQGFGINAYDSDVPTYAPSSTRETAAEIPVRAGEESPGDIKYKGESGHIVSGTVKFQGTTGGTLALVPVGSGFMPAGNSYQPPGSRGFALYTVPAAPDKEGAFVLRNVLAGQYIFKPSFFAKYWYLQSITLATPPMGAVVKAAQISQRSDAARNWTAVKFGDRITGLTITLAEGAASLRGRVDVGEGLKIPASLFVYLVPTERERAEDVLRYFVAAVAPDGSFALNNIPPGHYWSIAHAAGDTDSTTTAKLRLPAAVDARSKLRREGENLKLQTELKPCRNVIDYRLPLKQLSHALRITPIHLSFNLVG